MRDPEVIRGWFRLVENTKAKHGILDDDTYNFDESGFMMGMISTGQSPLVVILTIELDFELRATFDEGCSPVNAT